MIGRLQSVCTFYNVSAHTFAVRLLIETLLFTSVLSNAVSTAAVYLYAGLSPAATLAARCAHVLASTVCNVVIISSSDKLLYSPTCFHRSQILESCATISHSHNQVLFIAVDKRFSASVCASLVIFLCRSYTKCALVQVLVALYCIGSLYRTMPSTACTRTKQW
jgi:hypothetical protein